MLKPKKEEMEISVGGAANYANRFVAASTPSGVRIAFMESVPESDQSHFRSAVLLSFQDAIELKNLLYEIVEPIEKQLKAVTKKSI